MMKVNQVTSIRDWSIERTCYYPCIIRALSSISSCGHLYSDTSPRFDYSSRLFELDSCGGFGKVCLAYKDTKSGEIMRTFSKINCETSYPNASWIVKAVSISDSVPYGCITGIPAQNSEIWFLDRGFNWHFISDSFLGYFRLMLTHLGLPHWQYSFTDTGVPPQSQVIALTLTFMCMCDIGAVQCLSAVYCHKNLPVYLYYILNLEMCFTAMVQYVLSNAPERWCCDVRQLFIFQSAQYRPCVQK